MEPEGVPVLLEALFIYGKVDIIDKATKAALRLCNKHFKNLVNTTVTAAATSIYSTDLNVDLNALLNTEWHGLQKLRMCGLSDPNPITELPSALFVKFSRLEALQISHFRSLEALPVEIGQLQHLKTLKVLYCLSLTALPTSLGQLTTLEKISLSGCHSLIAEGLAPLQHLTGLTSLELSCYNSGKMIKYPDFVFNLTSLKELTLSSPSIDTLPDALGNLTNLESLTIELRSLKELPESIGNLNALKAIGFSYCFALTTLPESLDDLLWRKAHETEKIYSRFFNCPNLVFSPKMKQVRKFA